MQLVLSTFGTSLNRDNEGFVVTQQQMRQRLPADDISSIQISNGASITSDAVLLAIEKEIEIIFVDKQGKPQGRIWSPKYGSISTIRKGQLAFTQSRYATRWITDVISRKIHNQQALLLTMVKTAEQQQIAEKAILRLQNYQRKVDSLKAENVRDIASTLRGWEGAASHIYFDAMNIFLPEYMQFSQRTQHPAMDAMNACLNYGYGILYGKVEGALISAGIDPYIGILHRDEYNRPVLVYDVIEMYRIWIDYVVYGLACQQVITSDCYSVRKDGSYWLEGLGRRMIIQSVNDYLDELVEIDGLSRTRLTHLKLYTQNLAQKFKQYQ